MCVGGGVTISGKLHLSSLAARLALPFVLKFLVANDESRLSAIGNVSIRDGLIAAYEGRKVRVRISGNVATAAVKGPRTGVARPEFEYEIPIADAEKMFSIVVETRFWRHSVSSK
jgi:adenylate cyclase